jgi:SAM-dependent methyltransferase
MDLPFESRHFDLVNCCGALHLFPEVAVVLREIHRVLKPGGRFTAAVFRRGSGALAERRAQIGRSVFGIDAFAPDELSSSLQRAGLSEARCLHAAGRWLIMSAVRSEASAI